MYHIQDGSHLSINGQPISRNVPGMPARTKTSITEAALDDGVAVTGVVQDNRASAERMAALRINQPLLALQQSMQHLSDELRQSEISVHKTSWYTTDKAKPQTPRNPLKDVLRRARGMRKSAIMLTAYF